MKVRDGVCVSSFVAVMGTATACCATGTNTATQDQYTDAAQGASNDAVCDAKLAPCKSQDIALLNAPGRVVYQTRAEVVISETADNAAGGPPAVSLKTQENAPQQTEVQD